MSQYLMRQNVPIPPICILPTHFYNSLINIGSISFFSSFDTHQSHHLLECHAVNISSSLNSFLSSLRFSNLVSQAKSLIIIIIVLGSSSSTLSSRLILLRSILIKPISL